LPSPKSCGSLTCDGGGEKCSEDEGDGDAAGNALGESGVRRILVKCSGSGERGSTGGLEGRIIKGKGSKGI